MSTLEGRQPRNTYKDLLQVSNVNRGVDATLRPVEDGEGTESALKISTTTVSAGNISISGNTITTTSGDLTIDSAGGTVVIDGTTSFTDPIDIDDGGTGANNAADARTNLGLGTIATQDANNVSITGGSITGITDLAIADGGTGASTASGARTNLGLGTIATQDANNVSITGGSIAGITDLAVADGGTGASSFTAYAVVCGGTTSTNPLQSIAGVGTSGQILTSNGAGMLPTFEAAPATGVTQVDTAGLATGGPITSTGTVTVTAATAADQETGTSTTVAVVPGVQQRHASAAKGWAYLTQAAGTYTLEAAYNVTSVNKDATGTVTITWDTDFSTGDYCVMCATDTAISNAATGTPAAGSIQITIDRLSTEAAFDSGFNCVAYGDQ